MNQMIGVGWMVRIKRLTCRPIHSGDPPTTNVWTAEFASAVSAVDIFFIVEKLAAVNAAPCLPATQAVSLHPQLAARASGSLPP